MSYFKKIGNTISVKSKEFVKSAKAVSETSSLNNIIKAEQQKIDTNYKMMGKLYFEKFSEGPSEDFAEYVSAIKSSQVKIDEVNEEIAKIKRRNCCPNCGVRFRMDAFFCSKCGTRVREEVPEKEEHKCLNCGNVLEEGAVFCDNCGTKTDIASEGYEFSEDPAQLNVIEAEVTDREYIASENTSDLSAVNTAVSESNSDNAVGENKVCPSCHAEQSDPESKFCVDCGAEL